MSDDYAGTLREDRRGQVLRILHDQPSFALNDGVLQDALGRLGHKVARDIVRDDLEWLSERGLVQVERAAVWIASLTQRGEDVAAGRSRAPGVKRPDPRG